MGGNILAIFLSRTHGENNYRRKASGTRANRRNIKSKVAQTQTNKRLIRKTNAPYTSITQENIVTQAKEQQNLVNIIFNNVFRLTIFGVGIGTIFGSVLANTDLTKPLFPKIDIPFVDRVAQNTSVNQETNSSQESKPLAYTPEVSSNPEELKFSEELTALRSKFDTLRAKYPQLEPGAFFVDLDNGAYVNYNGIAPFPAASTIKIPVLVAFLQDIDEGKIYLDEKLTMTEANRVPHSGNMQYQPLGTEFTALYTATEMIINSDNTATEMIIERLGGKDELNKRFQEWGLENTVIRNLLPDLEGTNTTSPRDLGILLAKVNQGDLLSVRSRDRLLEIMRRTKTQTLLPQGLENNAIIAHKTGDIGTVLGDAGIIDMPTGKRYIGAVLVKRPHNDYSARTLIQEISRTAYQHFKWYLARPPISSNETSQ
ncbi:serine hydrolase [Cyanobacterium aponinum UTEX 3221]|uniref:serine hydrolase n=1 Tax=Cyanobacterium aponinum TaxID=379064 RepID=UPI002B4BD253|nr:serine hydrolase [Cyanobacterium aponinum]WRL38792.1 serine hydrolase [Cyanobacterium aponinum UTEX 3221]